MTVGELKALLALYPDDLPVEMHDYHSCDSDDIGRVTMARECAFDDAYDCYGDCVTCDIVDGADPSTVPQKSVRAVVLHAER